MKRKRKTWLYRCASAAILATLIGGNAWAASYNQGLTGSTDDASWLTEGTVSQSGNVITYDFGGTNQTFTSEREPAAYLGSDPNTYASTTVIINNAGGTLYLTGTNSINNDINGGRAIAVEDGGNVTINSNLNLRVGNQCFPRRYRRRCGNPSDHQWKCEDAQGQSIQSLGRLDE